MAWNKEWTIESVENNYRILGMIDPEDVKQLIEDSKNLVKAKEALKQISEIEDKMYGEDWEEIEEARIIANVVLRSM